MAGADVFVGLSAGGIVSSEMVHSMAGAPIIFAMANPDPEITYDDAKSARNDTVIMATGRSDYLNQVNNVLGFPFMEIVDEEYRFTDENEIVGQRTAIVFAVLLSKIWRLTDFLLKARIDSEID